MVRHQFAVISLAALAIVSSFWFLLDVLGTATRRTRSFGVAQFESRFSDFPRPQAGVVLGYVSDNPPNDPSYMAEFHLTQYVLAPTIVKPSANEDRVIVNYHSKQIDTKLLRANHLAVVRDFGSGLALCRRGS